MSADINKWRLRLFLTERDIQDKVQEIALAMDRIFIRPRTNFVIHPSESKILTPVFLALTVMPSGTFFSADLLRKVRFRFSCGLIAAYDEKIEFLLSIDPVHVEKIAVIRTFEKSAIQTKTISDCLIQVFPNAETLFVSLIADVDQRLIASLPPNHASLANLAYKSNRQAFSGYGLGSKDFESLSNVYIEEKISESKSKKKKPIERIPKR